MKKKKIAFLINKLGSGGAERVVTTLANRLCMDYHIYIITYKETPIFYPINKDITVITCNSKKEGSKNTFIALQSNFVRLKKINKIVAKKKIDLLIGFMTSANVLATLSAKMNSIPVIISERNNPSKQKITSFWKFMRIYIYPIADYLVVQTHTIRDYYAGKIHKDKLLILPNPISPELTQKRNMNSSKKNVILNVGSLSDQKAQDILIKAFAMTLNEKWRLAIVGEGPNRKSLEILIKKLGLEHQVLLSGRIKDVSEIYNTSKIFAFSSLYEGFPNALIEAMHFGLPCVSTDCPTGPSELIENDFNGYLVPVDDKIMMSEKLQLLMDNENKRNIMGNLAMNSVQKFELEAVIHDWKNLIDTCIS